MTEVERKSLSNLLDTFKDTSNKEAIRKDQNVGSLKNKGKNGSTWDAKHMGSFLNESRYSSWNRGLSQESFNTKKIHDRNSTQDHFFRGSKETKNVSTIGFTNINPLVALPTVSMHSSVILKDYCYQESPKRYESAKFSFYENTKASRYQGNNVKFRVTDPLTFHYVSTENPSEFEKERMKWLIAKRHPHGITGVDHSEAENSFFYKDNDKKFHNPRIREEPNSHKTHIIDPTWKAKGRSSPRVPSPQAKHSPKIKQFDNRGFNIITNIKS